MVKNAKLKKKILACLEYRIVKFSLLAALFSITFYLIYEHLMPEKSIPLLKAEPNLVTKIKAENIDKMSSSSNSSIYGKIIGNKNNRDEEVKVHSTPEQPMPIKKYPSYDIMDYITNNNPDSKTTYLAKKGQKLNIIFVDKNDSQKQHNLDSYYSLELASVRTEEEALSELAKLQKVHYKIIGNLPYVIDLVNIEKYDSFYKLLVGNFVSFSEAKNLCRKIRSLNHRCLVVKSRVK